MPPAVRGPNEEPRPRHSARAAILTVGAVAVALLFSAAVVGGVFLASGPRRAASAAKTTSDLIYPGPGIPPIDRSSLTSDALASPEPAPEEATPTPWSPRLTTNANIPSPALDAFIAQQYPGYRVLKRISFPSQYDPGRLGENYLLQSKSDPRFRLLVSVAMLKQSESIDLTETEYEYQVGRVLSTDGTFSKQARKDYDDLAGNGQDAIARAIARRLPTADSIVVGGDREFTIDFDLESGKGALQRAMQDEGGDGEPSMTMSVTIPSGNGSNVEATLKD